MRLTTIGVQHFQALVRAEVAFGPGLNVLYGPNDFGKSTLAHAIRAALLLVPTSAASAPLQPWHADEAPRVALSFESDDGQHWQVKKTFGTDAHSGTAELLHSKDGVTFALDAKGRQVEERLRTILGWGIAAPGGKGGPRGLPESFLAQTLLAGQTDVDRILGQSLAEDATDAGKVRLSKALATLAQDPLFKAVLDAGQREVDVCFTPRGQRKRGQGSRFVEAGQVIKEYESQLAETKKLAEEAATSADRVTLLRSQQTERMEAVGEAQAEMGRVSARLKRWQERGEAEGNLRVAREALTQIDLRASEVAAASAEVERLSAALRAADGAVTLALAECEAAEVALRTSEEAHRAATNDDSARARGLRIAHMKVEQAENIAAIQTAEAERASVQGIVAARKAAEDLGAALAKARADLETAKRNEGKALEDLADLEKALASTRVLAEYGRWKATTDAVKAAREADASARTSRDEAIAKERGADVLTEHAVRIEAEISAEAERLPTADRLRALVQLEREVEKTEAALGGGLTVVLRPRQPVAARVALDQSDPTYEASLVAERVLEAERSVRLTIGDLLDVDITAGAAEKRRELASLRARWTAEVVPVLAKSGRSSLSGLDEALKALAADRQRLAEARREAEASRTQAAELRARAALHEEQAAKLGLAQSNLDALTEAIRGYDPAQLESRLATVGKTWEGQLPAVVAKAERSLAEAQTRAGDLKNASGIAAYRVTEAEQRTATAVETAATLTKDLAADPESLVRSLAEQIAGLSLHQKDLGEQMAALASQATGEVERLAKSVETARARLECARDSHASAAKQRETAFAEQRGHLGQRDTLKVQLDAMNRPDAERRVKVCEEALGAFAGDVATSEAELKAAESRLEVAKRSLDETRTEVHHAEGALSKVGGMAVAEEVERLSEAIASARAREQELEVDADAYKLLVDTLREVENAEGAHLGRALAGPVTARFRDLTEGRYGSVTLTAALKTEGVRPVGAAAGDVLEALSVGTREQLATLIRLAIAEQLKSAIILDDQLVQTDHQRLAWFRDVLRRTSLHTQVIVLTCRPEDYLQKDELPSGTSVRDLAGGTIRAIDFACAARRWSPALAPHTEGEGPRESAANPRDDSSPP